MRKNLKEARVKAGMTQQQLADRLGVGLRYYKMIEAGTSIGSVGIWDKLEDIFSIHQRVLRETRLDPTDSQLRYPTDRR